MKTSLQRWGNSLAIRVPESLAQGLQIEEGSPIEMAIEKGALVIRPLSRQEKLLALLDQIEPDQLHAEAWGDEARSQEAW